MSVEQLAGTQIATILLQRDARFANRFATLIQRIIENTGSVEYTKLWLNAARDDLEGRSPLEVIGSGYIQVVEDLMTAYETGQPE